MTCDEAFCLALGRGGVPLELVTADVLEQLRRSEWWTDACADVLIARDMLAELAGRLAALLWAAGYEATPLRLFGLCFLSMGYGFEGAAKLATRVASPASTSSTDLDTARAWLLEQIRSVAA